MAGNHKKGFSCDKCGTKVRKLKELKRLTCGFLCKGCAREKRLAKREEAKAQIMGTRTRRGVRVKEKPLKERKYLPAIKPVRQQKPKISALGLYITKVEKTALYYNLKQRGLDSETINKRIKKVCDRMSELKRELKEEVKTQEELNNRFKEEFAKLCMEVQND